MSSLSPGCSGDTSEEVQESDSVNELPAHRSVVLASRSLDSSEFCASYYVDCH